MTGPAVDFRRGDVKDDDPDRFRRILSLGRAGEEQDSGTDWSKTWGIPFLLGAFGLYWHFKRDKKRALAFLGMFILLGWMTAWYQNQQDPQPRERDYFYVGAFYIYAMWIGIGATGMMELLRAKKKKEGEESEEKVLTGEGNTGMPTKLRSSCEARDTNLPNDISEISHSRVPVKNILLFGLKL